eukprot:CAMPEP_0170536350 /NCGR_PEP_ID=MMETSP0209-20121228/102100_1 /TAXON_ID=665100 ORGANISM="Litonotus pictus, Strain P1" /NCGR_SAMPLE_ID=MMETSP0209 /ASSEMBLY_ACC=CAM_ASM_000301 /LENGTH=594 /DNA_ID=CAMNT_0010837705 /DNA_START=216 /DNA_END=2000 /DNA_ORIENTATION=-
MTAFERGKTLNRIADLMEKNRDELAGLEALDNGKPKKIANAADLQMSIDTFRYYAGWADKFTGKLTQHSKMKDSFKPSRTQILINGKFVNSVSGKTFDTINPSTQEVICKVQEGDKQDIHNAVVNSKNTFEKGAWSDMTGFERGKTLNRIADLVEKNRDELAGLEALDNGKPKKIAYAADLQMTIDTFRYYAGWADKFTGKLTQHSKMKDSFCYTVNEPVGVVGAIIPWNFPITMASWKIAPCLSMGNTIVVKPAEQTPLSILRLGELALEAGLPEGVLNIVPGYGPTAGAALANHPLVDKVAFTGSSEIGLEIMRNCHASRLKRVTLELGGKSPNIILFTGSSEIGLEIMRNCHASRLKRVTLELGGKSPNIILEDANLDLAVEQASMALFFNNGQCCVAGSRTFVHESIYDEFVKRVTEIAAKQKLGSPFDNSTDQGPLVDEGQHNKYQHYVASGIKEGAKLMTGGKVPEGKGFFAQPTVFADVKDEMEIAKEEIFGPVMSILKFKTLDEVIERANNTAYGLGAGVVGSDINKVNYVVKKLRVGQVYVNSYNSFDVSTPFGGFKNSGIGRELGENGLYQYVEPKTVIIPSTL